MMNQVIDAIRRRGVRACIYALVATAAIAGVAAPAYAMSNHASMSPMYMTSRVKYRYKAFAGPFYVSEYDTTYREIRYNNRYEFTGTKVISYTNGWYGLTYGKITQFECQYRIYN